ncbi:MAG: NACHT domain-containing protein [Chloroflexi bacterium]|nr:NACHT domain-containing protein [Chloroflexota bacterium]
METLIVQWLVSLFGDFAKAMAKRGGSALLDWLKDEEAERQKLLFAVLPRAYADLQNTLDAPQAGEFQRWLNERAAQKDKALGDALLNALFFEPNGVVALSADLQARVPTNLHSATLAFLSHLHRHLWNYPEFEKHLQAKTAQDQQRIGLRSAEALERISPRADYASEEKEYLKQLVAHTELLEFIGIPEVRDRTEIKLEDVFIPLGAEEEVETSNWAELVESARRMGGEITRLPLPRNTTHRVPIDEALRAHTLMIVGDPGAGKSTLLRYVSLMNARAMIDGGRGQASTLQNPRLPILIPLRRFAAAANQSLVEFFYAYAKQTYQLELSRGFFERALEEGRCIVCLDGLDEVFVSNQRVAVRDAVAALTKRYPQNKFIITSRIVGYESAPLDKRTFAHYTILPFNENEIETFVRKWYAARERDLNRANKPGICLTQSSATIVCESLRKIR